MVHEVRKKSAMVRSLRDLEWREEKGEERGFAQREGVRAAVSPKEENRRGSATGTGARIESRQDAGKKENAQLVSMVDAA